MAYKRHPMLARIELHPAQAAAEILEAYRKSRCDKKATARRLDCDPVTLSRWVRALDDAGQKLTAAMAKMKERAKREGWHHDKFKQGGRPRLAPAG